MSNKYTNIGEVVVTSTITGKAQVRMVQKRNLSRALYWIVGALVLGGAATWLVLDRAPATVTVTALPGEERESEAQVVPGAGNAAEPAAAASQLSPQQLAKNAFERAQELAQQGKTSEAIEIYRAALLQDTGNDSARQAMVDLLLKSQRSAEAERALQIGLKNNPNQSGYSLQLARLLAGRNELSQAQEVMQRTLPYAAGQADYQAYYALLLQRQNQHDNAIAYYQKALALKPGSGEWLMGMGISLKAAGRAEEADAAFKRALETKNLSAKSRAFVEQQIPPAAAPAANPPNPQ
jgi:MSHA biogenesis protein MshN